MLNWTNGPIEDSIMHSNLPWAVSHGNAPFIKENNFCDWLGSNIHTI
jgi:hypothetical protein